MRYKRSRTTDQNFWVAYADLMAGLLFVFILLIGAIVVKYVFMQSDLQAIRTDLEAQKRELKMSEEALAQKKRDVASVTDQLIAAKQANAELTFTKAQLEKQLQSLSSDFDTTEASLAAARALLAEEAKKLEAAQRTLTLSAQETEALKALLLDTQTELETVSAVASDAQASLARTQQRLTDTTNTLKLKEGELELLAKTLLDKTLAHQKLVEDLDLAKARVRNLTGIRIKVIQELKEKLGDAIDIDTRSGAIRLPSSVLFDVGSSELKPEAQAHLKATLLPYFDVLLGDESIREHLDRIIIEGHTDSDGSYMYNLDLSQKRALSVMELIYSWEGVRTELLQQYLSASGRSYSDRVFKNGVEDKEASRRIEIKFSISNKKAIEEIETFLKGNY
jgi:chemotaxis protein MotB